MTDLAPLLVVQEHDSATDHLRHRRATLPERQVLARAESASTELAPRLVDARGRRDVVLREVKRLEDEASAVSARAAQVEKTMYSGTISSPKELQAMQADVEQLGRHQRTLEDRELDLMVQQEALDTEVGELEASLAALETEAGVARTALAELEARIDAELAREAEARELATADVPADVLALYERCRAHARGVGAARLVGNTCQGCRLTIPATEVDRMRRAGADAPITHCDNCGAILVIAS